MGFGNPFHAFWVGLYPGTPAERGLEPHIAALGIPYRTQFPFFIWGVKYFPDFLLWTLGLIVEVDDDSHDDPEKQKADALRTSAFEAKGWRVLRCTNEEALERPWVVVRRIVEATGHAQNQLQSLALGPGLPPIPEYAKKSKRSRARKPAVDRSRKRASGKGHRSPSPPAPQPHQLHRLRSQTLYPTRLPATYRKTLSCLN